MEDWPDRLSADALLLQRATGLRIGELVDLEMDCIHEVPGQGAWLKVPRGKLQSERMVPLDEETVALVDRIVAHRLTRPRVATPAHRATDGLPADPYGRRVTVYQLREVITRVARDAGLPHITPHQLRHTYATAYQFQRRRVLAEPHGLARPCVGGDEPALRPTAPTPVPVAARW